MDLQQALRGFWSSRATRERRILAGGGVLLALLVFYLVFIGPAVDGIGRLRSLIPQARARAAQLEALVAEAKALRSLPQAAAAPAGVTRAALEKSLDGAGLKPARSEVLPGGDLRLNFVNVPFGKWTAWLAASERAMGVHTVAAKIKADTGTPAAATPGNADIELTLHLVRAG